MSIENSNDKLGQEGPFSEPFLRSEKKGKKINRFVVFCYFCFDPDEAKLAYAVANGIDPMKMGDYDAFPELCQTHGERLIKQAQENRRKKLLE